MHLKGKTKQGGPARAPALILFTNYRLMYNQNISRFLLQNLLKNPHKKVVEKLFKSLLKKYIRGDIIAINNKLVFSGGRSVSNALAYVAKLSHICICKSIFHHIQAP